MRYITLIALVFMSSFAHASDIQQQQTTLYPFRTTLETQDDFIYGTNTSGNIGIGWGFSGGTVSWIPSEPNRPGIIRRDTSASASTLARTDLQITNGSVFDPSANHRVVFSVRLNNNDTDTMMRVGMFVATFSNPPLNGFFIEKLLSDTNWFCVVRNAGVQTRIDSSIPVDVNFHTFSYTRNSSGVQFSIDGLNVCGIINTNISSAFMNASLQIFNNVASSKTMDIDYFQLTQSGLSR